MSKKKRDPLDRYYTPTWATEYLVEYLFNGWCRPESLLHKTHNGELAAKGSAFVWEPSCGEDWIGRVLRDSGCFSHYVGTDLDPTAFSGWERFQSFDGDPDGWGPLPPMDFLKDDFRIPKGLFGYSLPRLPTHIIGNPPYLCDSGTAAEFVLRALEYRRAWGCTVAMLLRVGWLEPCKDRVDIWQNNPPTEVVVLPRVNYLMPESRKGNGNNQTSAWFIWDGWNCSWKVQTALTVLPRREDVMNSNKEYSILGQKQEKSCEVTIENESI